MNQDQLKQLVAQAARDEVLQLPAGQVLGVGTGSTVNCFIDAIAPHKSHFAGAVSSSNASTERLLKHGFTVLDPNDVVQLPVYVDGADEIDPQGNMIKGGGGALTREKIIASMANQFLCICDASKQVPILGHFPLPVEVMPMACAIVTREMEKIGGKITLRLQKNTREDLNQTPSQPFITDNGGWILEVSGLSINNPPALEAQINQIAGVLTVGIFAKEKADVLLVSNSTGVERIIL
ncbi:ribose-5-phosphate isomerase RpiA [Polynucleobacter paneuropaeus]|jgi:ribose 5-phosphate isomerase A|uniref:Ribose-5-phosphate isomerase A n=1 Tax=Polynucleobacter paneuropaeus TaxID=2527775 RepID=A0A2Z4JSN5_9BURK|nr:ribose-5-phosphate isomerase RpiA [Polynucleobacter paneuropaeus]AWW49874.1 ribose 5-phosphate isomerase A [Polynucleobacter paneuropaeus]MBT8529691.1 ribose-5-phosphate isomerase RpiA [Polynucleobacter paneuropaeus]MBT8540382.1 ribose-5-phosphate isomerase RpiA [Polynucleobacter paneuropaeus]MBT8546638.1 ribose-5-phosphate isomerase RpiA [Polynucleobacter paneuropaeus]MBT8548361.1 ribose-5-phosphate isomerase RpiA [Polynucleobacter paneuropaeus]